MMQKRSGQKLGAIFADVWKEYTKAHSRTHCDYNSQAQRGAEIASLKVQLRDAEAKQEEEEKKLRQFYLQVKLIKLFILIKKSLHQSSMRAYVCVSFCLPVCACFILDMRVDVMKALLTNSCR